MIISIDLGETVVTRKNAELTPILFPDVIRVIRKLVAASNEVHVISRVNTIQEKRSREWLAQLDFLAITGIPEKNLHYCPNREDKAQIARNLKVTHHIDDRPEVMIHFDDGVKKYLFRPEPIDVLVYFNRLKNTQIVRDWNEVEKEILSGGAFKYQPSEGWGS